MSAHKYTIEFDKLCLTCDLDVKKPLNIACFFKDLNRPIAKKVEVLNDNSFDDMCSLALKFEAREKKRSKHSYAKTDNSFTKPLSYASYSSSNKNHEGIRRIAHPKRKRE